MHGKAHSGAFANAFDMAGGGRVVSRLFGEGMICAVMRPSLCRPHSIFRSGLPQPAPTDRQNDARSLAVQIATPPPRSH
jgi:hypothetical protein